jgi:selenide, water dikinase
VHSSIQAPSQLLVGLDTADDAAVYQLTDDIAIVQTVDFFTPVLDDPYDWGRVTAANALSDVYAMGGRPVLCLNLVGWPRDDLPLELLSQVLQGGLDVATQAGAFVAGGHSVDDREPKYGMCVTGVAHPAHLFRNTAAKPGDKLVLTKPLGSGILASALKAGLIEDSDTLSALVQTMTTLNADAAEAAHDAGCRAATDVSGFGLLGHLTEVLTASDCGAQLQAESVPLLPEVRKLAAQGVLPGGSKRNLEWVRPSVVARGVDEVTLAVLADAQTSGGLLLCWPHDAPSPPGAVIGAITEGPVGRITVIP